MCFDEPLVLAARTSIEALPSVLELKAALLVVLQFMKQSDNSWLRSRVENTTDPVKDIFDARLSDDRVVRSMAESRIETFIEELERFRTHVEEHVENFDYDQTMDKVKEAKALAKQAVDNETRDVAKYDLRLLRLKARVAPNPWNLLPDNVSRINVQEERIVSRYGGTYYRYSLYASFDNGESAPYDRQSFFATHYHFDNPHLEQLFSIDDLPFRFSATTEEDPNREELGAMCTLLIHSSPDDEDWEVFRSATIWESTLDAKRGVSLQR